MLPALAHAEPVRHLADAAALQRATTREVTAPDDQRSEGLLALPQLQDVAGKHIVIVRGNAGRELIKQGLLARGAKVSYVQSYKRVPLPLDGQRLSDQWRAQQIQCIVVTSNEILSLLLQSLPATAQPWLAQRQWIMVSQRMAAPHGAKASDECTDHLTAPAVMPRMSWREKMR